MAMLFCALLLPAYSAIVGLLGFWIGRCARRLPIIDDKLPWTLSRGQIPTVIEDPAEPETGLARWPQRVLRRTMLRQPLIIRQVDPG
jgi:hypothetical protein